MEVVPNQKAARDVRAEPRVQSKPRKKHRRESLFSQVVDVEDLTSLQVERMFQLFAEYYDNHPRDQFIKDLFEKTKVILLMEKKHKTLQGFSTILEIESENDGVSYTGVYSGDTVLSEQYWGSPQLGIAFLQHLWKLKIKRPFQPLYWFLISKGYKTYLLMANNFDTHFPRYEKPTDLFHQQLMHEFYSQRFKETFDHESMRIVPKGLSCQLKPDVACVKEKFLKNPRIAFFQQSNPNWQDGQELCCIAKMTLFMPLKYSMKKLLKSLLKKKVEK